MAGIRQYLSGWAGIGRIEAGMARQGFDLELTRYDTLGWGSRGRWRECWERSGPEPAQAPSTQPT
jgi:hypothetical protein